MNLPLILDIGIGLIFIYLILSLLASELQEFIATIFQWRAKHLKESIEILLAGDSKKIEEIKRVRQLADQLYDNPLIENINQEAKGWLVKLPRWLTWQLGQLYRWTGHKITGFPIESVFGDKRSGPSYIPAETFATTLLEIVKIPIVSQKVSNAKLNKFKNSLLKDIKDILCSLDISNVNYNTIEDTTSLHNHGEPARTILKDFSELTTKFDETVKDFKNSKTTLDTSIERMEKRLERYILIAERQVPEINDCRTNFQSGMESLKRDIFSENERKVIIAGMKPSLTEVVKALDKDSAIYVKILDVINEEDGVTAQQIKQVIESIPKSLIQSIYTLANRAQARVEIAETDINQLRKEIELWFDRSMERTSGVYKRNAKGVAILLGFVIALTANADTFQIASSLSKDSVLRSAVTSYAQRTVSKCPKESLEDCIVNELNPALTNISLPIGWNFKQLQRDRKSRFFTVTDALAVLKKILGWFLTGLAVSMGANFWFDLLGKVINVRNAGPKPASSTEERPSSNSQSPVVPTLRSKDRNPS